MNCEQFEELILDDIDGSLASEPRAKLRDHLSLCEACRSFQAVQVDLDRSLSSLPPPPELSPQFSARTLRAIVPAQSRQWFPGFAWELAGVGAVAAAAAFCTLHFFPNLVLGAPWVAAGVTLCAGACFALADPPSA